MDTPEHSNESMPPIPLWLRFRFLAWFWVVPSAGAVFLLFGTNPAWRKAPGLEETLRALALEQWVALAILLLHPILIVLSLRPAADVKRREEK